tara:strand:+ start:1271 stop:1510 length:240 start_codon:yes stop_codon:yes gene_type:complete
MGFHKRYITDETVLSIYHTSGCQAVIDWYTRGADAIIISGKLAREVNDLMNILVHDKERGWNRISEVIVSASNRKAHES